MYEKIYVTLVTIVVSKTDNVCVT